MNRTQQIETRLREALTPRELTVIDDSESHRGHGGYQEGGESHFHVIIRSDAFEGKSRIARHRMVHKALGPELVAAIHALSMDLDT
ncbi:MAG: BolA family transcriptional regulator [Marivita sp.]|uniref:BolA family protein n=1 Tax=Marivita sp. TaxID=2003365 RepID=UPI001B2D006F|nr:BolA family protein [Marivita sp.]MBO6884236.1 BolA family transcriptional regulator [Marivita sp.]